MPSFSTITGVIDVAADLTAVVVQKLDVGVVDILVLMQVLLLSKQLERLGRRCLRRFSCSHSSA